MSQEPKLERDLEQEQGQMRSRAIKVLTAMLILSMVADFFVDHHPHFGLDASPFFAAWYGLGTCVVMVFLSKKVIGFALKRKDTYYDD